MVRLFAFGAGLFLACVAGCNSKSESVNDAPPTPSASEGANPSQVVAASPQPWKLEPATGKAIIVGRVSYDGTPPKSKIINMGPEKKCHDQHKAPPTDESLVVGADKSIRWVLVHIVGDVPGDYSPPTQPATLDQQGCVFIPHVLAVQAGQPILVLNSDEVSHNVRCSSVRNSTFNFILPTKGGSQTIQVDSPELGMGVKCDIHFWMNSYIHAIRHPFFYVTDTDGWFKIENVPPGAYKLEARHEKLNKQSKEVTVKEGDLLTVDFVFSPK